MIPASSAVAANRMGTFVGDEMLMVQFAGVGLINDVVSIVDSYPQSAGIGRLHHRGDEMDRSPTFPSEMLAQRPGVRCLWKPWTRQSLLVFLQRLCRPLWGAVSNSWSAPIAVH
jgi:hypothetical protein